MESDIGKHESFEQTQRPGHAIEGQPDQQPTDVYHEDLQIYDDHEEQHIQDEPDTRIDQDLRNYMLTRIESGEKSDHLPSMHMQTSLLMP